jgi:hypothetical protein
MSKARDLANAGTALGAVTATELGYVDGVTSAIQTQLDGKASSTADIPKSTVTTKGDILAATASATVARLAVGTDGQVLTAASGQATGLQWATPAAGGMTSIASGTLSGASVSLTSIPATYNNLVLIIRNYDPSADQSSIYLNFNSDTGANRYLDTTALTGTAAFGVARLLVGLSGSDDVVTQGLSVINIPDYANATTFKFIDYNYLANDYTTTTQISYANRRGYYNQVAAISSIQLTSVSNATGTAGTFSGGTYILYGVK